MADNNLTSRIIRYAINSKIALFILLLSVLAGLVALSYTPREEEPQIVVPMVDVTVFAPSINARQVERQVTTPLEKLLAQISGVEHVYSTTTNGQAVVTLRFFVGENRENSILNTYNKLHSNVDKIPSVVSHWFVKPAEVDDVPLVMLGLWSDDAKKSNDFELRRLAEELAISLQAIKQTSEVNIVGGRARTIQININPEQMAARKISAVDIIDAVKASNILMDHGNWAFGNQSIRLETGETFADVAALSNLPVKVNDGTVVLLREIATILDGPEEQNSYSWIDFTSSHSSYNFLKHNSDKGNFPLVTISVAKQKGSNAVEVAEKVHQQIAQLQENIFPPEVHIEVLRDYGQTANEKVNDLTSSLGFAVFTVVIFIGVFLGWRPAMVVGLAVPICYGITLSLDLAFGYTINRVTLFALILSLGLLVDDPITGVDNIERKLAENEKSPDQVNDDNSFKETIVAAINEIRVPLVMSSITIILAFIPLAFITGMMGPYMAPMAFNVPISIITSTLVAFMVTPWLAAKLIKPDASKATDEFTITETKPSFYQRMLSALLNDRKKAKRALWLVLALFIVAALLPVLRLVPLKLLPFDNKNEVQIIIDMPESATLEVTAAKAKEISLSVQQLPEVKAIAAYVGTPSPIDFNGLVRHYYQRVQPYHADLRLTLLAKAEREHQSHAIVLRLRELLAPLNENGVVIKVVEVPPGPPVLSTLVAEIYGDSLTSYEQLRAASLSVQNRLSLEPHVVEIDSTVGQEQQRLRFISDKTKAALSGISTQDIAQVMSIANEGEIVNYLHVENEINPLAIKLKLAIEERKSIADFNRLMVKGRAGVVHNITSEGIDIAPQQLVALGELGRFERQSVEKPIHHKDLKPVVYVTAELSGRTPAEVIADVGADFNNSVAKPIASSWNNRTFLTSGGGHSWSVPDNVNVEWSGEGEWKITIRVFRDMGLAFAFALIGIYVVLRVQTASMALSLIIMSAIPLTIIGIMPGFYLLNQFGEREVANAPDPVLFTATAMIGMIALAGIVVRNSLILVDFITQARAKGATIKAALISAGTARIRPVLLTAGTTMLGNLVITLDPVFSGLAIAIIFGIIASTLFTLFVVPIVYLLVFENENSAPSGNEINQEHSEKSTQTTLGL
tara:strand:- start:9827 stop:13240 length:3414 start_codon:yes stop_codon:yes gene_type:complete